MLQLDQCFQPVLAVLAVLVHRKDLDLQVLHLNQLDQLVLAVLIDQCLQFDPYCQLILEILRLLVDR